MKNKKVVACIASRIESSRLPEKVLAPINGIEMNNLLIQRLKTCKNIDAIVLCTADTPANDILVTKAKEWGVPSFKGAETDVLKRFIGAGDAHDATHIIRVTGDNVFTDPMYLDRLIAKHIEHDAEYGRVNNLPLGFTGEVMTLDMAKRLHASLEDAEQTEYMVLYAYNPEKYRCLVLEAEAAHRRPYYAISIDVPADLELVQKIMADFPTTPTSPSIDQIVHWLDTHPHDRNEFTDATPIRMPYGKMITYKEFMTLMNDRASLAHAKLAA